MKILTGGSTCCKIFKVCLTILRHCEDIGINWNVNMRALLMLYLTIFELMSEGVGHSNG